MRITKQERMYGTGASRRVDTATLDKALFNILKELNLHSNDKDVSTKDTRNIKSN